MPVSDSASDDQPDVIVMPRLAPTLEKTLPTLLEAAARASLFAAYRVVLPYGGQRTALRNAAAAVARIEIRAHQRRLAA